MVRFETKRLQNGVTRIDGINGEQAYLVEGSERAALIDTTSGVGDIKSFTETLTRLPVVVLLTHGHVDHAMGAPQFNEVYMNFLDGEIYWESTGIEARKAYLTSSPRFKDLVTEDFIPESAYAPIDQAEIFHDLKDAAVFDLGKLTIEAVSCPGHSPGSTMFLIRELRVLISGDACCFFTMLQGESCLGLTTYERNLKHAKAKLDGRFDYVLMSHSQIQAPITLMDEVLECIEAVKTGTDDRIPFGFMGTAGRVAKAFGNNGVSAFARIDGKVGNLVYDPSRIWE